MSPSQKRTKDANKAIYAYTIANTKKMEIRVSNKLYICHP